MLWRKASKFGRLPSELVSIEDEWTAYQFDNAVTLFGTAIENAVQEQTRVQMGNRTEYRDKYTLGQLLRSDFRLPRPPQLDALRQDGMAQLMAQVSALAGQPGSGIRRYEYVGPVDGGAGA